MKKLLLVGSSSIHTFNYLNLIRDLFEEVEVISDGIKEGISEPIHQVNFSLRNPVNVAKTIQHIKKTINRFKPDIIHVHQANSCAWLTLIASKDSGIPVIVTAWGSDILLNPDRNFLFRSLVKVILKKANAFTSDSSFMADKMRALLPEKKLDITIANFGIEEGISPGIKEDIVYSNRLHKPLYRIDKIIKAFDKFIEHDRYKHWKLIVAATGEETDYLKALTSKLGLTEKVEFVGWLDKIQNREYYSTAKIYVSIPESDATAISLLEAMAAGCTPVLSDLPANREWVKHDENGIIVSDLEGDFIFPAMSLDASKVISENTRIISEKGTRMANKEKFKTAYLKLLKVE